MSEERFPEWATSEYHAQRVVVEERDGVRVCIRFFEQSILGYIPLKNGLWFKRNWIDVTHMGMPHDMRAFIDGGERQ